MVEPVTSSADLLDAHRQSDDTFSELDIEVRGLDIIGDKGVAEWSITATHSGPLFIDDDVVVEPTRRRLHISGVTIAEFSGDRVCAFRSYYDHLALLEQALANESIPPHPA